MSQYSQRAGRWVTRTYEAPNALPAESSMGQQAHIEPLHATSAFLHKPNQVQADKNMHMEGRVQGRDKRKTHLFALSIEDEAVCTRRSPGRHQAHPPLRHSLCQLLLDHLQSLALMFSVPALGLITMQSLIMKPQCQLLI